MKYDILSQEYVAGFCQLVNDYKQPNMVVAEIGVHDGATTIMAAPIVKSQGGKYIAVDWFIGNVGVPASHCNGYDENKRDAVIDDLKYNIKRVGCGDILTIYAGTSLQAVSKIEDKSLDICFIDADHRYKHVHEDILAYTPKVKDGGILAGHDFDGGENRFNTFTADELSRDCVGGIHPGVTQAIGELIGFEKITKYPNSVWAVRINKDRQFEKL